MWCGKPVHNRHFEILTERRVGSVWIEWIMYVTVMKAQNSKYKLEGKILHQQCNRLFPARCQTYAN